MKFDNDNPTKQMPTKQMIKKIYSGNAILFVGAGFSLNATNFDKEICFIKTTLNNCENAQ